MADQSNVVDRIESALRRIEAATAARDHANATLSRRHSALRARMTEAVSALDSVLAQGAVD